jgi:hypothetical protein
VWEFGVGDLGWCRSEPGVQSLLPKTALVRSAGGAAAMQIQGHHDGTGCRHKDGIWGNH